MKRNLKVGLIETDTYRPGAYYQLKQLAEKINALFYGEENSKDPISILKHGLEYMQKSKVDLVIIDTAGRHRNEEELLREAKAIYDEAKPDEVMLVIDATIGRQAAAQTEAFMKYVPINSVFLTKMEFVARLLGMGDLDTLIEKIRAIEEEDKIIEEIEEGKMNLLTIKKQLDSMLKLGPLSKIMELLPTSMLPMQYRALMLDEEKMSNAQEMLRRWRYILDSMTKEELLNPEIINASRIRRIAKGAGVTPKDVKELLNYYQLMKRMVNQIKKSRRRLGRLVGE